jgi:hypothetical protein
MTTEQTYFFNLGAKGEAVETAPNDLCTQVTTPTGRIMITVFYDERSNRSWVTFKLELSTISSIARSSDGMRVISEHVGYTSLAGIWHPVPLSDKAKLEDLLYGDILNWLGQGALSGRAQVEAVWSTLWNCLRTSEDLREAVAEHYPRWIKGLHLGSKKKG